MIVTDSLGISGESIVIPRGKRGLSPMTISLTEVHKIEAKIPEIRRSTPLTLPDLVTSFILGMSQMSRIMALVEVELRDAKRSYEEMRAVALLEKVEKVLQDKKIKSSTDTREAAIVLDTDVKDARIALDMITAVQSFLAGKHMAIEAAYHGAKKLCDVYLKTPYSPNLGGEKQYE